MTYNTLFFYFCLKFVIMKRNLLFLILLLCGYFVNSQTTVTYTQQTGNYYSTFTTGTAGNFNQGATEMGMYANGSGTKQVASFRKIKTDGNNGGSDRSMQVGDRFTIRVAATRAFGQIGVALLASPSTGSWANRHSNYAIQANLDGPAYSGSGYGNWYLRFNGGATSATTYSGDQTNYRDFTFEFTLTAPDRMNVAITTSNGPATTTFNDVQLNTSNPITDFCVYLEDDWDGDNNSNIFWKQTTTNTNTGAVSLGSSNNSFTVSGVLTNGLDANSTTANTLNNALTKTGTGTVTLTGQNTYTGSTTLNNGILRLNRTGGSTLNSSTNVVINTGATLQVSTNQTINNLTINTGGTLLIDAAATLTVNGNYTGGGTLNNQGTINISGSSAQSFPGASTTVNNGTANTLSNLTISNTAGVTLNQNFNISGVLTINTNGIFNLGSTNTISGAFTTSGSGTLTTQNTTSTPLSTGKTWNFGVNYNANGAQTIVAGTYNNLTCTNTSMATKTMDGNVIVNGVLNLSTSKLAINGNTLTLGGTVSNNLSASNSIVGSNTSTISVTSSTAVGSIFLDNTTSADVTVTDGTNALRDLLITGTGSVTLGNKINLFRRLNVNNGGLDAADNLVLRSTSSNTAYVDQILGGGYIDGQVVVERFIHKQFRGWRMITAPVTYDGIISNDNDKVFNNWQSDFGYTNNYGTRITANVAPSGTNGIDNQTNGANLLTYNSSGSGSWNRVTNTKTETMSGSTGSADNKGFFIFLRGDRTVIPTTNGVPNSFVTTTLASKGLLQSGPQLFNYGGAANNSWLIGNPYACPVDMSTVTFTNIGNFVYFWDPNLVGITTESPGAYTYFDRSNWNLGPVSGSSTKFFQSGQAFLVKPTSATASIEFVETNKAGNNNNTQTTGTINGASDIFNVKLMAIQPNGDRTNVDGVRAKFGNYSASVDEDDCNKIAGAIESISISNGTNDLAIESRPYISGTEELKIKTSNLAIGSNYEFYFNPINFDASVSDCKLVDAFLNTETPISLTINTTIPFTITNVPGSNDANRFKVVFNSGVLSNKNFTAKAFKQNDKVVVNWSLAEETNIINYEVQKSTTSSNEFLTISTVKANNNNSVNEYSIVDNTPSSVNYYRVKYTLQNGKSVYSNILKVDFSSKNNSISIYPNPVKGNTISLQTSNIAEGKATINVFDNLGKLVFTNVITNTPSVGSLSINIPVLQIGAYNLQLIDAKNQVYTTKLISVK